MLSCPHCLVKVGPVPGKAQKQDNSCKPERWQGAGQRNKEKNKNAGCRQGDHRVFPRSKVLLGRLNLNPAILSAVWFLLTLMVSSTGDFS